MTSISTHNIRFMTIRSVGPTTINDVRKCAIFFRLVYAVPSQLLQWDFNWICDAWFGCWINGGTCCYIPGWNLVKKYLENSFGQSKMMISQPAHWTFDFSSMIQVNRQQGVFYLATQWFALQAECWPFPLWIRWWHGERWQWCVRLFRWSLPLPFTLWV